LRKHLGFIFYDGKNDSKNFAEIPAFACPPEAMLGNEVKPFKTVMQDQTVPRSIYWQSQGTQKIAAHRLVICEFACFVAIGCPTSSVAQRAMREAAPHARGASKARQLSEGWRQSKPDKLFRAFSLSPFPFSGKMTLSLDV
jgi:hypothetical protein